MEIKILFTFIFYLLILFSISVLTRKSSADGLMDYFSGGKKMNPFIIAVSSSLATRSSWIMLGFTTIAYIKGYSAIWTAFGFIISDFLVFTFLGSKIIKLSSQHNFLSFNELIMSRFRENKNIVRIVVSVGLLFFLIPFLSSEIIAGARGIYALLGVTWFNALIVSSLALFLYFFFGGFKSASYADIFNSLIIVSLLVIIPVIVMIRKDGYHQLRQDIISDFPNYLSFKAFSIGAIAGIFSIAASSSGNIHMFQKFMSLKSTNHFPFMVILNSLVTILMTFGAFYSGVFAKIYFPSVEVIPGADVQNIFFGIAAQVLPTILVGIILVAIFASAVSVGGSLIFTTSSILFQEYFHKKHSSQEPLSPAKANFYNKFSVFLVIQISFLLAVLFRVQFREIVVLTWTGISAAFGPAILLTFLWNGITDKGFVSGIISGTVAVVVLIIINPFRDVHIILLPAFILSFLTIVIVSKSDKKSALAKQSRLTKYADIKKSIRSKS